MRESKNRILGTIWGEKVMQSPGFKEKDENFTILNEYPRPVMQRDCWQCLNGFWDYSVFSAMGNTKSQDASRKGLSTNANSKMKASGKILVPFSPETYLSTVHKKIMPQDLLHYHKVVKLSEEMLRQRMLYRQAGRKPVLLLHFGAVDQVCQIYINGKMACRHVGGYLPFTVDITKFIHKDETEFELEVRVKDVTDSQSYSVGKQTLKPHGMYYPGTSGIWQTVWLECVCEGYIKDLFWDTDYKNQKAGLCVKFGEISSKGTVKSLKQEMKSQEKKETYYQRKESQSYLKDEKIQIHFLHGEYPDIWRDHASKNASEKTGESGIDIKQRSIEINQQKVNTEKDDLYEDNSYKRIEFDIPKFKSWSPENPYLYEVEITLYKNGQILDQVRSYFAMKSVEIQADRKGIQRIFLNGKPYFQMGLLDQGYWPESMYTPPSDEAMQKEIRRIKKLGFNMIRKHIKVEPQRWYYHCDRLGMLVWQDMINGGGRNKSIYVTYLATFFQLAGINVTDRHPFWLSRQSEYGKEMFKIELAALVKLIRHNPSVVSLTIFNEGWGQFETNEMTQFVRKISPRLLIDQASGWFDMNGGDFKSIHNYFFKLTFENETKRAVVLSEFGGYAMRIKGHCRHKKAYGYRLYTSKAQLENSYEQLMGEIVKKAGVGISATIYTQLCDVEGEINGLWTYDRKVLKIRPSILKKWNTFLKRSMRQ